MASSLWIPKLHYGYKDTHEWIDVEKAGFLINAYPTPTAGLPAYSTLNYWLATHSARTNIVSPTQNTKQTRLGHLLSSQRSSKKIGMSGGDVAVIAGSAEPIKESPAPEVYHIVLSWGWIGTVLFSGGKALSSLFPLDSCHFSKLEEYYLDRCLFWHPEVPPAIPGKCRFFCSPIFLVKTTKTPFESSMSRQQLQESEASAVPDKAMLATVLNFLKNKNLKVIMSK